MPKTDNVVSLSMAREQRRSPALDEAVASFLLDRRANGATKATLDFYRFQLLHLQKWCASNGLDLPDLTTQALRRFLVTRETFSHNQVCESARREQPPQSSTHPPSEGGRGDDPNSHLLTF